MKNMKTYRLVGLTAVVLCGMAAFQARAVTTGFFTLYFDENANGSWSPGSLVNSSGPGAIPDPGQMLPDPTQAGHPLVLTYMLPVVAGDTVISGDIRIWDDPNHTILSDVICFTDAAGDLNGVSEADRMIFYSGDHLGSLADTGIPATLFPTDGGGTVENSNGSFEWDPAGAANNVYIGLSDVPEPGALSLLAAGLSALFVFRKRSLA